MRTLGKTLISGLTALLIANCESKAHAYLYYDSATKTIIIGQPIKENEISRFRAINPRCVVFWEGADKNIFADSRLFPRLVEVHIQFDKPEYYENQSAAALKEGGGNDRYSFSQLPRSSPSSKDFETVLRDLAKNYPYITSLFVYQKQPITESQLSLLKEFKRLRSLTVRASLLCEKPLAEYLPNSIETLSIENSELPVEKLSLGMLANLRELRMTDCELNEGFCRSLQAPLLKLMNLNNVKLDSNCFDSPSTLPALKEINLSNMQIDEAALKRWSAHASIRALVGGEEKMFRFSPPKKTSK